MSLSRLRRSCDRGLAADGVRRGVEPLTPDDIAEVIVFAASRRENVVVADTLVFPNHQVPMRNPRRRAQAR